MTIVIINILLALFAPLIAPYGETNMVGDVWESFSVKCYLGTDHIGRDLFTRLVYGARNTIALAFITTILSFLMGSLLGFIAAVKGGWTDQLVSRIIDTIMAFPTLIFALMILSVLGSSIPVLICTIAILDSTRVYRLSRAVAMDIEVMEFAVKEITEKMNKAALYITHDLAVVAQVAHRIMVLRNGRLVEEGETRALIKRPKEKYTGELLSVRALREEKSGTDRTDIILEVKDIAARYTGGEPVLEDIDLVVRKGKTVALVGESGSGKSTLARVITGLLPAIQGGIEFLGKSLPLELKQWVLE